MAQTNEGEKLILKNNKKTKHISLKNKVEIVNVESYKRYNHTLNDILDNCFADQNFKNNYDKLYNVLDNVDSIIFFLSSDQNMDTLELIYINLYNIYLMIIKNKSCLSTLQFLWKCIKLNKFVIL